MGFDTSSPSCGLSGVLPREKALFDIGPIIAMNSSRIRQPDDARPQSM